MRYFAGFRPTGLGLQRRTPALRTLPADRVGVPRQAAGAPRALDAQRHVRRRGGTARREAPGFAPRAPNSRVILRPDAPVVCAIHREEPVVRQRVLSLAAIG